MKASTYPRKRVSTKAGAARSLALNGYGTCLSIDLAGS